MSTLVLMGASRFTATSDLLIPPALKLIINGILSPSQSTSEFHAFHARFVHIYSMASLPKGVCDTHPEALGNTRSAAIV